MVLKKIFNADDFGISPGVNQAIVQAYNQGVLNSASLMVNQKYTSDAVVLAKKMPQLDLGLHLNLTNEQPVTNPTLIPLLVGRNGKFKNGFVKLFLLSIVRPKTFRQQIETEIRAQITKYLQTGLNLKSIDGHRHIHLIPAIFKIVKKIQQEYHIPRIRIMNENLFNTIRQNASKSWLMDGALIKYMILRTLCWWNGYHSDIYFYSILYTCKLSRQQFQNVTIPKGYKAVEVMFHPGMPKIDKQHLTDIWDDNILSPYRSRELETLLDKTIINGIN